MQFNTFAFLFVFLPITYALFWVGRGARWRMASLVAASYCFYLYWDIRYGWYGGFTAILIGSTSIDYFAGVWMSKVPIQQQRKRKLLLVIPIIINLSLLAFFKYAVFTSRVASEITVMLGGQALAPLQIILPIGISFYTFEAISQLVDIYRGVTKPAPSFLEYACFISMFPRAISGPIVRYRDVDEQFAEKRATHWPGPDWHQMNIGLMLFTMGMCKKVLVADRIAEVINPIWQQIHDPTYVTTVATWAAVLGYTFQLYFDFSGYSDMAVGLAHFFGLKLPQNFDSPYKATDARDFWRRWHMTLSAWLRDYLYIPLGGNRTGHRHRNLMITMLLGGFWHGADWQFILWGGWHGLLLVVYGFLRDRNLMPSDEKPIARFFNRQTMFLMAIIGWVMFRSISLRAAGEVYSGLFGLRAGPPLPHDLSAWFFAGIIGCWLWCNVMPNSFQVAYKVRHRPIYAVICGMMLAVCIFFFGTKTDFLYFQF